MAAKTTIRATSIAKRSILLQAVSNLSLCNDLMINLSCVYLQRENIPAAIWITTEIFQNLFGNLQKSLEFISFSINVVMKGYIYRGFETSPSRIYTQFYCSISTRRTKTLFLLLMDGNLAEVLQGMFLGEDKSIITPADDDFCAMERGGRSILGCLLNLYCQNMGQKLITMPKIWKVHERARGIALTKERFQFIFDLETDIQMVLNHGFWTFDDWGMAMERWVETPPPNFLQTAAIWARLYNLLVNYLTLKTIDAVADGIGHVKVIEFDPNKPLLHEYVRFQVVLDLNQPIRDKKIGDSSGRPGGVCGC